MANHDRESSLPICQNCSTSTTPLWRRDEMGSVLCNACGLFLKLHGRPRPISLKTDVIKSRNRVKTSMRPDMMKKKVCIFYKTNRVRNQCVQCLSRLFVSCIVFFIPYLLSRIRVADKGTFTEQCRRGCSSRSINGRRSKRCG